MEHIPKLNKIEGLERTLNELIILSLEDRVDLLLVAQGEKPACILEFQFPLHDETGRDDIQYDVSIIERELNVLSIPYEKKVASDEEYTGIIFYIGKDQKHLQKLLDAGNDPQLRGRALGYPKTAADFFASGEKFDIASLPEEIQGDEAMTFLNFKLSKEHWLEEFSEVKKRAEAIRLAAPELYEKILASKKEH